MLPVLLIEDDPDIRALAALSLELAGLEVAACQDGASGLRALESATYGLIILDVMMPDMSGFEVLRHIRERWGEAAPPVAFFTARPQDTVITEVAGRERVHILPKPFDPATLAQRVQDLLRN